MASFKNNGKLKLLIIVGTRPEIIRLAAVITKCRKYFDTILAHTGQNYDYNLNGVFFHDLELADPEVYMDAVGETLGQTGETVEFEVSGDKIESVYMVPGWTHNIINLSETDDLVTVMTCNEIFEPNRPDTFFEKV